MTKVIVDSGACGFSVIIIAKKDKDKKIRISLDTECEMVKKMLKDISTLDVRTAFTNYFNNPVYRSAAKHLKHVVCPVVSGILKAVEVEAGVSLPKNVSIVFLKDEPTPQQAAGIQKLRTKIGVIDKPKFRYTRIINSLKKEI